MLYRPPPRGIKGKTIPRLWTPPLRPLNRRTTDGYDVADFAEMRGHPLQPWQRWVAIHALELLPDGTYRFRIVLILVARQNGKSDLKREITLWRMYTSPKAKILGVAQDLALARDQWSLCQESIDESPLLQQEWGGVRNVNGDEYFWLQNRARYRIKAANRKAGRGGTNDEVNIDEMREQTDWKAWAAVSKTTQARADGQIFGLSNAGDDTSAPLNQLRSTALAETDPSIGIFEYSGAYDEETDTYCDLDDWAQIAQANPGLGHIISPAAVASSMSSDPPEIFRTEVLCQRVRALAGAIDMMTWPDLADAGDMTGLRKRLAACIDVAPDGAHATLSVAAVTEDGRVRGEIVAAWDDTDGVRRELAAHLARIRPVVIGWFPAGPAAAIATVLRPSGPKAVPLEKAAPGRPAWVELTGGEVGQACQGLADLVRGRRVIQPGDPLLDAHAAAARKLKAGDGWRFTRAGEGHVDAVYSFAGAVHLAQLVPEPKRARVRAVG